MRAPLLGAGVLIALGAAIAAAAAPGSPVRVGGVERTDTWTVVFLCFLAVGFALYLVALYLLRSRRSRLVAVLAVGALIQVAPLVGPLLGSRDVYSYWAYGRIVAQHDRDPFTIAPSRFPHDPATRAVARGWRKQTSLYGPAFTLASAGISQVAKNSAERASLLFRVGAAVAAIGAMLLAASIARRRAYAAAFVGWNPVLAVSFAGGGHNDAWMLVLVLAALALVAKGRDVAGGTLWILAAAIKAPALVLLLLQLLRSRRGLWLGVALAAASFAAVALAVFGTSWLTSVWQLHQREARYGLPARLEQLSVPDNIAHGLAYLALIGGAAWLALQALRGRTRLGLGAALLVVTSPWVLPWYSTWAIVLASVEEDLTAQLVALGLVVYLLPDRIPL